MTELKPCPFCGGKVEAEKTIEGVNADFSPSYDWVIYCWNCDFKLEGFNFIKTREGIENLWNRRVKE